MEEYTQITLDQWMQWKEDIRGKLGETAGNFVYIGYRLKQIRDSGMYDGAADIFEFAMKEFGMGKSTVSRFIAINEKYSKGGNSLELKEEFKDFSSSKLGEMLTLPDSEIQLITDKTTVKEIRELKRFNSQDPERLEESVNVSETAGILAQTPEWTPLEKCVINFFRERRETLNAVMECVEAGEYKQAAELMAPSGQASHKKGIVFLFLYDWDTGIKYKMLTQPDPVSMTWEEFLQAVHHIYESCERVDLSVATSQQITKTRMSQEYEARVQDPKKGMEPESEDEIPGQDNILNHPEYLPLDMIRTEDEGDPEAAGINVTIDIPEMPVATLQQKDSEAIEAGEEQEQDQDQAAEGDGDVEVSQEQQNPRMVCMWDNIEDRFYMVGTFFKQSRLKDRVLNGYISETRLNRVREDLLTLATEIERFRQAFLNN